MSKHYVAFSGGLDSTYIVNKLLSEGKEVVIVHINTGAPSVSIIPELYVKRNMINDFHHMYPNQITDELSFYLPGIASISIFGTLLTEPKTNANNFIQTLPQQLAVRNALIQTLGYFKDGVGYVGWHKDDVGSTFDQDHYFYLADIEKDVHCYNKEILLECKSIQLPCWDLDKLEMFNTIPEIIRDKIIGSRASFINHDKQKNEISFMVKGEKSFEYYNDNKVILKDELTFKNELDPIDFFIAKMLLTDVFGNWIENHIFYPYMKDVLQKLSLQLKRINKPFSDYDSSVRTMHVISKKFHLSNI